MELLVNTLHNLGFSIHPDKAQVIPPNRPSFQAHQSEQQENAVPGASRQDPVDPSRDLVSLLRKQQRHSNRLQVLKPIRQAKFLKWSGSVGTATPLAAAPPDGIGANACSIQGLNASKLASCRGDAMVAR